MRALMIAVIVMGLLIMVGTMALVIAVVRRPPAPVAASLSFAAVLDEPAGTHIAGIATVRDRLVVQLQGGGADRVVVIDPATGAVTGRLSVARPN